MNESVRGSSTQKYEGKGYKEGWFLSEGVSLICFWHLRTLNKMNESVRGSSTQKYEGKGCEKRDGPW